MDDHTRLYTGSSDWEPTVGADGRIEISINYYHNNAGRYCSDSVHLPKYIELFETGLLKWRREGTERPDHNPDLQEARRLLKEEEEVRGVVALQPCGWRTTRDRQSSFDSLERGAGKPGNKRGTIVGDIANGELAVLDDEDGERDEEVLPDEVVRIVDDDEGGDEVDQEAVQALHARYSAVVEGLTRSFGWSTLKVDSRVAILAKKMEAEVSDVQAYLADHRPLQRMLNK